MKARRVQQLKVAIAFPHLWVAQSLPSLPNMLGLLNLCSASEVRS